MRILGFVKHWSKLDRDSFTTFRFSRKDKDWQVDEKVQIVIKPRSKDRKWLGIAKVIAKEKRNVGWKKMNGVRSITFNEAIKDGFNTRSQAITWFYNLYGDRILREPMNKLTLTWLEH